MNRKEEYITTCLNILKDKRQQLNDELDKLQLSLNSETKSSAGDKYETSREMINQEKNKLLAQFAEIEKQENALSQIKTTKKDTEVQLGSIVSSHKAIYFLSTSMGKVTHQAGNFLAISPASPIGQLLIGKKEGEKIVWLGKSEEILRVE
ncbi:GreA/GreB family elongation factor [Marivirga sp. S37H4]|uniref:GreA/GreB family elongation factor n=1 Tax=Marivirga aurantiaca TaxID=2802615 RepID=A0A935C9P5_9BACT|nr:GreA/GreB family elongation factor [Marivirga aurantiaca]MBK6265722.1 GreA/GreB family elongation factor [Marivirga aurantiaca]